MTTKMADPSQLPLFWDFHVEKGSGYNTGGYPPVHLGDIYAHRYKIIHKLGHGGFATAWLARDQLKHRYVALKMKKSLVSETRSSEREMLHLVRGLHSSHSGRRYISHLLDSFTVQSPNGNHECLVFELNGPSIKSMSTDNRQQRLWAKQARAMCKQLLMAVSYIHTQNVIHADITPGNLLLGLDAQVHRYSIEEILGLIGHPQLIEVKTIDGSGGKIPPSYPRYVVKPANLWGLLDVTTPTIYLTDFGEAFDMTKSHVRNGLGGIPPPYKAPEVWFERAQGAAADIWAAACCFHDIRFGFGLFEDMGGAEVVVIDIIDHIGDMPDKWSKLYFDRFEIAKPRSDYPKNKAQNLLVGVGYQPDLPVEPDTLEPWPEGLDDRHLSVATKRMSDSVNSVDQIPMTRGGKPRKLGRSILINISPEEALLFSDLLSRMLTWRPSERSSSAGLLHHEWFDPSRFAQTDVLAIKSMPLLQSCRPSSPEPEISADETSSSSLAS